MTGVARFDQVYLVKTSVDGQSLITAEMTRARKKSSQSDSYRPERLITW